MEVLVASAVGLMLLTLVHRFLLPMSELQALGSQRADLQRMAVHTLNLLAGEVRNSSPNGISLLMRKDHADCPVILAFFPIAGVTADGTVTHRSEPVLYYWDRKRGHLVRQSWVTNSTREGLPVLGKADLLELQARPSVDRRVVTKNVTDLRIRHRAGEESISVSPPLSFDIELTGERRDSPYRLSQTVSERSPSY